MEAININQSAFEKLQQSGKPFLVDYWAPWCVYCRRIAPAYEKIAEQYGDRLTVTKLNIDDEPKLADKQGIQVIPTLVMYRGDQALGSVTAPGSKAEIEAFIEGLL